MQLRKAERRRQFLRLATMSPTGGGKTFTNLRLAHQIAKRMGGARIAVIDTEEGTSELYQGEENPDGGRFEFELIDLSKEPGKFCVENYQKALKICRDEGIAIVIVDSASHAWAGEGGVLAFVDRAADRNRGNSFAGWKDGTPLQQDFVRALVSYPGHVLITMRVKSEWVIEKNEKGQNVPRLIGLQPVQREGIEYEFTCVFDLERDTKRLTVGKTRCSALDGYSKVKAGADLADILVDWLDSAPVQEPTNGTPQPASGAPPTAAASESVQLPIADRWSAAWESLRAFVAKLEDRAPISEAGFFKVLEAAAATGWSDIAATDAILWGLGLAKWSEVPGKTGRRLVDLFAAHPFAVHGEMVPHAVEV